MPALILLATPCCNCSPQIVPLGTFEDRMYALINGTVDAVIHSEMEQGCRGRCSILPLMCRAGRHKKGRQSLPAVPGIMQAPAPCSAHEHSQSHSHILSPLGNPCAGFTVTAERAKLMQFVYPAYYSSGVALFAPGGEIPGVRSWGDLAGKTLAVKEGAATQQGGQCSC